MKLTLLLSFLLTIGVNAAELPRTPAFPGAEGAGKWSKGGRGGKVIAVTNLDDSGPGSLREALEAKGPRTVVFRASGTIELKTALRIREPFITVAGQTAPGDGICLKNDELQIGQTHDVIRDSVDTRIIGGVRDGTGRQVKTIAEDAWPLLRGSEPETDTDGDGLPDAWEKAHALNSMDAADAALTTPEGWTHLEVWMNGL